MYQTARGDNYFLGTLGPGTTVLSNKEATLKRVFWGGTFVGTLALHDSSTAAGVAASNQIISLAIPLTRYPESIELNIHCGNGIVAVQTGTPTQTVVWGE